MEIEKIYKRLVLGLTRSSEWQQKLIDFFDQFSKAIKVELTKEENNYLAGIIEYLLIMIYSATLKTIDILFGGEIIQINLIYYPEEEDEDDLDISSLSVVDWDVDQILIQLGVEDLEFANQIHDLKLGDIPKSRIKIDFKTFTDMDNEVVYSDEANRSKDKKDSVDDINETDLKGGTENDDDEQAES